jgi:outer membrane lipoprotein SlyB
MNTTTHRLRTFQFAVIASAVVGLSACSKSQPDVAASNSVAPVPEQVAVAPVPAPVTPAPVTPAPVTPTPAPVSATPAPAPTHVVVAQNDRGYDQGRRDQQRQDARRADREPLPRADRDSDVRNDRHVAAAACQECGVVTDVTAVQVEGKTNGVGAVAGGVGGAVVGNRIAGHHNRTLGGVVGAVGGGLLGNAIEKHQRTTTAYDVNVRMEDGSHRTVRESTAPAVGEKVRVEADGLHQRG